MNTKTRMMIKASIFTALTAIGAFIKIPFPFVPIVLQVFFVIFAGCILGSKWAFISQLAYILIGLVGFPIFANGGGIGYVLQPTFGYLIGYMVSAYVVGYIIEKSKKKTLRTFIIASFVGMIVIYLIGVPYLAMILKLLLKRTDAIKYALTAGLIFCIPGDIIKCYLAGYLGHKIYGKI